MLHAKRTVIEKVVDALPRKWWWPFGSKGGVQRDAVYVVQNDDNEITHTLVYDLDHDPGPQMVCARLCFENGEMVILDNQD